MELELEWDIKGEVIERMNHINRSESPVAFGSPTVFQL